MTQIRTTVIKHLVKAAFPITNRAQVENILVMAICHYRLFLKRTKNNTAPLPGRMRLNNPPKTRGPKNKKMPRLYLQSQIHYAWIVGKKSYPSINNVDYPTSPFIAFAEDVMVGEGIFRATKNWEEFRSFRKKALQQSGIKLVRGKTV
jgi:hypothetical protein